MRKDKLFGNMSPWSWALEPVRGCNLRCGHCATRLFPRGELTFVEFDVWKKLWGIIRSVTPRSRVEMANAGEPTLHPHMLDLLRVARMISPDSQIQITTNGTMLAEGKLTHRQLFDAGVNIIYVDMYHPRELHERLAQESREQWYYYFDQPKGAPGAWQYSGPDLRLVVLMEHPGNWPPQRKGLNRLGTFYNNLDWEAAKPFGLEPVTEPIARKCGQPFRYVSMHVDGSYELCCQDFMGTTCGEFGSVHDGVDGFVRFWFSQRMQFIRRHLSARDRAAISECAKCSITFSREGLGEWKSEQMCHWWDGKKWIEDHS